VKRRAFNPCALPRKSGIPGTVLSTVGIVLCDGPCVCGGVCDVLFSHIKCEGCNGRVSHREVAQRQVVQGDEYCSPCDHCCELAALDNQYHYGR
jgi:hypothetical protein